MIFVVKTQIGDVYLVVFSCVSANLCSVLLFLCCMLFVCCCVLCFLVFVNNCFFVLQHWLVVVAVFDGPS